VQCDQWRKAAEAAAAMFSAGNNGKIAERSMSMDNNYNNNVMKNKHLNFYDEIDDLSDLQRNKNGNVLKKIGVLWKKPQKTTG
jgi:CRISPR/Cas system CSM-associated protein Csm2 small subunit